MKINTVFLRDECVLPSQFDLLQEPFCNGWAEAIGTGASELDAAIRGVGWHFMWIVDSRASLALGRTAEAAIHRALAPDSSCVEWAVQCCRAGFHPSYKSPRLPLSQSICPGSPDTKSGIAELTRGNAS